MQKQPKNNLAVKQVKAVRIIENVKLRKPQLGYFSLLKPLFKKGS